MQLVAHVIPVASRYGTATAGTSAVTSWTSSAGDAIDTIPLQGEVQSPTPTTIVVVDDSLVSGVPAYADLAGDNVVPFVPLVVTLPAGVDPNTSQLEFFYSGSDPVSVESVSNSSGPDYQPALGSLRLWTLDGTQPHSNQGIGSGGDYITPNVPFAANLLFASGQQQATIYIEAVRGSVTAGDLPIKFSVNDNGSGFGSPVTLVNVTAVQDTVPDYSNSGLAGVAQGADGGNPMSNAYSGAVRLSDGIVNYATTDFSVPGAGAARTVSRVWTDQPGLVVNPSFGNGEIMCQLPYLIQATGTIIAVVDGQPYYFDQVQPNVYQERFFGLEQLTLNAAANQYTFTDTTGTQIVFNAFTVQDPGNPAAGMYERGAMLSATDVYGNVIKVTSYDMLGNTTQVSEGCDVFTYAYGSVGGNAERLTSVTLARNGHVIAQAQYTYYAANDPSDNGNGGDLEQVRVFTSASSTSPLQEVDGSYYHYYVTGPDDLEDAVTGPAYARLVAAVFGANATAAAPAAGSSASLNSADVSNYADQFTYGGQNRVNWQGIVGTGASSLQNPSAIGYLSYSYGDNGRSRGVGINAWMQVTTITLPSGATQSVYTNYAGEPMLSALTDSGDTVNYNLNGDIWNTYFAYDPQGRLLLTAEPSAVTQQPDSAQPDLGGVTAVVSSNQGLVKGTDYYGPYDATPGYVEDTYVEQGQQASTKALQEYYQYVTLSGNGVSIQAVADERVFSAATSNVNDSSAEIRISTMQTTVFL